MLHLLQAQLRASPRGNNRRDLAAPALIGSGHHQRIKNGGMRLQGLFDFLGENLFATGVDAIGTAPEHGDGIIVFQAGLVTGEQPGLALHLDKGFGGFLRVVVVTHRDITRARKNTHFAGLDMPMGLALDIGDDPHKIRLHDIAEALVGLFVAAVHAQIAGLGGTETIGNKDIGEVLAKLILLALGKNRTPRADIKHRTQVPALRLRGQAVEQGYRHGIPDNGNGIDFLPLDNIPDLGAVQGAMGIEHHNIAGQQLDTGVPPACPVHQRRQRHTHNRRLADT